MPECFVLQPLTGYRVTFREKKERILGVQLIKRSEIAAKLPSEGPVNFEVFRCDIVFLPSSNVFKVLRRQRRR